MNRREENDVREHAVATLETIIEGIEAGAITGVILAAETEAGMQFFTTYDYRGTIATAGLTNHWAIGRAIGDNTPTGETLQ